ncbi:MAG: sugar phosphate isomerase/epimerase [Treponema sp.]|jgi:sugar phosphate isomerase/epimerase|nr:sugar phosphate isomerase/epimerase [Treponema sp.]
MKIGVQLYTLRNYTQNPQDIEATLRKVKAMGFDMVQISGLGSCDIDQLAGWTQELGLEVCGTHSPWDRIAEPAELKKLIEEHKKLKCFDIGMGIKPGIFPDSYEGYTSFIKKLNTICAMVRDNGLTFGYHNHDLEFQKFNGQRAIDRLIEECPDLYFILDVFWVQAGGSNPSEYLDKLKERIKIVHLKDYRMTGRTRQFAEIGEGNLDWSDIIPRCVHNGIPYAVIEQDGDFLVDPFESLALSKKFLTENGYWTHNEQELPFV